MIFDDKILLGIKYWYIEPTNGKLAKGWRRCQDFKCVCLAERWVHDKNDPYVHIILPGTQWFLFFWAILYSITAYLGQMRYFPQAQFLNDDTSLPFMWSPEPGHTQYHISINQPHTYSFMQIQHKSTNWSFIKIGIQWNLVIWDPWGKELQWNLVIRPTTKNCYVALTRPKFKNWVGRSGLLLFFFFFTYRERVEFSNIFFKVSKWGKLGRNAVKTHIQVMQVLF